MSEDKLININGIREDLYQAMQIGDITLSSKHSQELYDFMNYQDKEIERLNNIIKETSEDLHQVVKWCTENKHNENTIKRYLVVDYGTIVGKINEIRTKLDKGE